MTVIGLCMNLNNNTKTIKRQFIRRSNMVRVTKKAPYNVRCSYCAKQFVSEVRTREKMCLGHAGVHTRMSPATSMP